MDALQIANIYQESGLTRFSHPNFYAKVDLHQIIPNDTYFVNQFALNNTAQVFNDGHSGTYDADIDAPEAWTVTTGNSNVTIAVLDEGLTSDHPDLPNTRQIRLNGSNFGDGDPNDPSPTGNSSHGNGCSGTIAATQNNNLGISGIAPNCKIMPIRIFNSDRSGILPNRLADAINFARINGADIISNSWGYNSEDPNLFPVIRDEIITATTLGRNNLGCVVVFSAGNNYANDGPVHFPSNVDVDGVLTVGASDRYDNKAYYSPLGHPLSINNQVIDLVAPSHKAYSVQIPSETYEAWTLDIPGDAGYNSVKETDGGSLPIIGSLLPNTGVNYLDYTGRFGGTSYACPQVAGVAALILSINPNLSQQEVFDILTSTADKVGGYTYINDRSNELGFGRLNAYAAVMSARNTTPYYIIGQTYICNSSVYSISNIPANATVSWSAPSEVGSVLLLSQNSPSTNQLTITNQHWYSIFTTLTANISIGGIQTATCTLPILNDNPVSAYYSQDACTCYNVYHPSQNGIAFSNSATFVHMCCEVRVYLNLSPSKQLHLLDLAYLVIGIIQMAYYIFHYHMVRAVFRLRLIFPR
jgi:subtilisin family serine protease